MWRRTRRVLLWLLPIAGVLLSQLWGIRDLYLLTDVFDIRGRIAPRDICIRNLGKIYQVASDVVRSSEMITGGVVPSQATCWSLLARHDPSIMSLDCHLVHKPADAYWHRPLVAPASQTPYFVSPHIFTRPLDEWKSSDIVAVDSQPRHFYDMRGPGIRCVLLVKWDGSWDFAYLDEHQDPSLFQQLNDFANGADGSDRDESWYRYSTPPPLDLNWEYQLFAIHVSVLGAMAFAWMLLVLARPTKGHKTGT